MILQGKSRTNYGRNQKNVSLELIKIVTKSLAMIVKREREKCVVKTQERSMHANVRKRRCESS